MKGTLVSLIIGIIQKTEVIQKMGVGRVIAFLGVGKGGIRRKLIEGKIMSGEGG